MKIIKMSLVPAAEPVVEDDSKSEAIKGMLESIERIRSAFKVVLATMNNVTKYVGATAIKNPLAPQEWADITFIVNTQTSSIERSWKQNITDPKQSGAYILAHSIAWQMSVLTSNKNTAPYYDPEDLEKLCTERPSWPLKLIWETACKGKYATYLYTKQTDASGKTITGASMSYEDRENVAGTASFIHSGISMMFDWRKESNFYQNSIPFACIIDNIRRLTTSDIIPMRMGTEYQAAIIFVYYEIILATYQYYQHLNAYLVAMGERAENRFAWVTNRIKMTGSNYTWLEAIERAQKEAYGICSGYYNSVEKTGGSVLGVNPEDLAKDPTQIGGMLEKILGIKGINMESIKRIPAISDILNMLTSEGDSARPRKV
jgi:hypothetical protein